MGDMKGRVCVCVCVCVRVCVEVPHGGTGRFLSPISLTFSSFLCRRHGKSGRFQLFSKSGKLLQRQCTFIGER